MTVRDECDEWLAQDPLPVDPLPILADWQRDAFDQGLQSNPHAIALATVEPDGAPAVRMVLCKRIDVELGEVIFYTDRRSRKGCALANHPRAAAVFYWGPQNRQARVTGEVRFVDDSEADAYFATRPSDSQLGAWASEQSHPIDSRRDLERRLSAEAKRFGIKPGNSPCAELPRPPHWVGYAIQLDRIELWVSRPGRIHDRVVWKRPARASRAEARCPWTSQRLQP